MNYRFFNKLLLRTPVYNYGCYNHNALEDICKTEFFKTAILIGSRSLYHELEKKDFNYAMLGQKQRYSVLKYFNRMCYRPTPFGLFAGYTLLPWKDGDSDIVLNSKQSVLHAGPGQELSHRVGEMLDKKLTAFSKYRVNHSLYRVNKEFRYYQSERPEHAQLLEFSLETFLYTPFIAKLLRYCHSFRDINQLSDFVIKQADCSQDEAAIFLHSLIEKQILQSAFSPAITGTSYGETLYRYCQEYELTDQDTALTGKIFNCFNAALPDNQTVRKLDHLLAELNITGVPEGRYYNSAFERMGDTGGLSAAVKESLTGGFQCLNILTGNNRTIKTMKEFALKFLTKFEGRLIPILQAVDPETGVGYGDLSSAEGELVQTIGFRKSETDSDSISWTPAHSLLMKLWKQNSEFSTTEILNITDEDMSSISQNSNGRFPTGLSVIFRMMNDQIHLEQIEGPSALRLIGRFSLFSEQVAEMANSLSKLEEQHNPDVIFAEIVHISDEYADNINRRSSFRSYEIAVLCRSELPEEQQIALSDLYIKVESGEVILYSAKHKKRVIPSLSSAFNYFRNDLPLFRFLCDLQYHGLRSSYTLDLATFFPGLRFYPRVVYKNTILHLAGWHIKHAELAPILKTSSNTDTLIRFKEFAKSIQIPRYFSVNRNDHQLIFDSTCNDDILFFADVIKNENEIIVKEFLPDETGLVRDELGRIYVNQFIACMYNESEVYNGISQPVKNSRKVVRKFAPGSQWLYLKIYCHPNRANELISTLLTKQAGGNQKTEWFFIRYHDPEHHIRLRLKTTSDKVGSYLQNIERKLKLALRWEQVEKIQADTYMRELERYGPDLIHFVETVFYRSSELTTAFIKKSVSNKLKHAYSSFALYTVNEILNMLYPDTDKRLEFILQIRDSFLSEYSDVDNLKFALDRQYRKLKNDIESALNDSRYLEHLNIASKFKMMITEIRGLFVKSAELNSTKRNRLFADILHMHLNRIFTHDSRKQETATYYFLYKFNVSIAKRESVPLAY